MFYWRHKEDTLKLELKKETFGGAFGMDQSVRAVHEVQTLKLHLYKYCGSINMLSSERYSNSSFSETVPLNKPSGFL